MPQASAPQRLVDTVAQIYRASGFQIGRPQGLAAQIAFLTAPPNQTHQPIAVGCFATDPSQLVGMENLDTFWQAVMQSGISSAVFVTNGYFDPSVVQAAAAVPLQLIDRAGLDSALAQHQSQVQQQQPQPEQQQLQAQQQQPQVQQQPRQPQVRQQPQQPATVEEPTPASAATKRASTTRALPNCGGRTARRRRKIRAQRFRGRFGQTRPPAGRTRP